MYTHRFVPFVIVAILFVAGVFVGLFFSRQQQAGALPGAPSSLPTLGGSPAPTPPFSRSERGVVYSLLSSQTSGFPSEIQEYIIPPTTDSPPQRATQKAASLGFLGTPEIRIVSDGTRYIWKKGKETLTVVGGGSKIIYSSGINEIASPTAVLTPSILSGASALLSSLGVLPPNTDVPAPKIFYFAAVGNNFEPSSSNRASAVVLTYPASLGLFPVYVGGPNAPPYTVRFTSRGELSSYTVYDLSLFEPTTASLSVVSKKQADERYLNQEGSLASVFLPDQTTKMYGPEYVFSSVAATRSEISYYFNASERTLVPVYVYYGSARDTKSGKKLEVSVFVSALP